MAASEKAGGASYEALRVTLSWGDRLLEYRQMDRGELWVGPATGLEVPLPAAHRTAWRDSLGWAVAPPGEEPVILAPGDGIEFEVGRLRLRLSSVAREERLRSSVEVDLGWTRALAFSAMGSVALLAALRVTPQSEDALADPLFRERGRQVVLVRPTPVPPERFAFPRLPAPAPAPEEEGRFGAREATEAEADRSRRAGAAREGSLRKVQDSGLLAALRSAGGAADAVLEGGLGGGIARALGGLTAGAGVADAHGLMGIGPRGTGPGGGGSSLGIGGLHTGGSARDGVGIGIGGRGKERTRIVPGTTRVIGGLSKEVIGEVIARYAAQIKACYEAELQKDPALQGKVAVTFTIDGTGGVSEADATENTLGTDAVADCIVRRIGRWRFPEPQGGGEVVVSYPWIFRAAGD